MRDAAGKERVTYKCKLSQEVGFYTHEDHVLAGEMTAAMCGRVPVHSIFGERPEMVYVRQLLPPHFLLTRRPGCAGP